MTLDNPLTQSADLEAMQPYWSLVSAINGGKDAMRAAGKTYLPINPQEAESDYQARLNASMFTNIFSDVMESLSARPFSREVVVDPSSVSSSVAALLTSVDGSGSDITSFAAEAFEAAVANALHFIVVDMPQFEGGISLAQFRASGLRPYAINVDAQSVVAVYSDNIAGQDVIVDFRYKEISLSPDDDDGQRSDRVRRFYREAILNDEGVVTGYASAAYEIYERTEKNGSWTIIDEGLVGLEYIPVIPLITGRKIGGTWAVKPPMRAAAELQVEHYQLENGLKYATTQTCFPMYVAAGVEAPTSSDGTAVKVTASPGMFMFMPSSGDGTTQPSLEVVEPSTSSLAFLDSRLDKIAAQLRELGRQPLTAGSQNITAIAAAFASSKSNSATQMWAIQTQHALERMLKIMSDWMNEGDSDPQVTVHTDFDVVGADQDTMDHVNTLKDGGVISGQQQALEAKRRNILSPNYDYEKDTANVLNDISQPDDEPGQ